MIDMMINVVVGASLDGFCRSRLVLCASWSVEVGVSSQVCSNLLLLDCVSLDGGYY